MPNYTLPEDDVLVGMAMTMKRSGSKSIPTTPEVNYLALSQLPRRMLVAREWLVSKGLDPLDQADVHDLIRVARSFEQEATINHGRPHFAEPSDTRSTTTMKVVILAILAFEAAASSLDGKTVPASSEAELIESMANEARQVGRIYAIVDRHFKAMGELVRRILALEARLPSLPMAVPVKA